MTLNTRTLGAIVTFILSNVLIWIFESSTGVSFDPFYYLNLILQYVTNALNPLMPTTGPLAQSTYEYGYFCTKPRKGILRIDKYIISNIFKLFRGSWLFFVHKTITKTK